MKSVSPFLFLCVFVCFELSEFVRATVEAPLDCRVTGDPLDISMPDMFSRLPEYDKAPYGSSFITLNFDTRSNEMPVCKGGGGGGGGGGDPTCGNTTGFCSNFYDIVISAEESTAAGRDNWIKVVRPFLQKTVKAFKISKEEVHMGIVLFASDTRTIVSLNDAASQDKEMLMNKVGAIDDVCTAHGVLYADSLLYTLDFVLFGDGHRENASKVSVLFTYGSDNYTNKPLIPKVIKRYKEACVKLIVYSTMITEDILSLVGCTGDVTACPAMITVQWEYIMSAAPRIKEKVCEDEDKEDFQD